jgi:DUF4097 and DUF4098 domain-containing protein YvlB
MRTAKLAVACGSHRSFLLNRKTLTVAFMLAGCAAVPTLISARQRAREGEAANAAKPSQDLTGTLQAHDGGKLRLVADVGSIMVHTHDASTVEYRAHLEADSSDKQAKLLLKSFQVAGRPTPDGVSLHATVPGRASAGRLWVTLEVTVPRNYSVDVATGSGNITTDDMNGRVVLVTQGGNIMTGNVNGTERATAVAGGHITVKNVTGEFAAETGGGHITTGRIGGNATMHTSGGHIRSESIAGTAQLQTGGGNIALEHAGGNLVADTSGGQIQVGEAAGLVRAKTDGGGIRVARASGAAHLESSNGNIYVTQVDGPVKASTETGGITAWFVSPAKSDDVSELESSNGDIVVYLSRALPVTIDAQVEKGQNHGFSVDPAFPIKVHYEYGANGRVARAEGMLNGGGETLRLRTVDGNIRFVLTDLNEQMHMFRQQMEGLQKQLDQLQSLLQPSQQVNSDPRQP